MSYDWRKFVRRIPVNSSPKSIYEAWTTQQGLESWFLRLAEFKSADGTIRSRNKPIEAGDSYKWLWYGYNDDVKEENKILLVNGWDTIRFAFSGTCTVTVHIKQEEGETICELTQEMPMDDEEKRQYYFVDCGNGWTFYLANLKSILEGGIDLRNKNHKLKEVVSA